MSSSKSKTVTAVLLTVAGTVVVAMLASLVVAYSGMVNVAAARPPFAPLEWFLATTCDHSVAVRADTTRVPSLDSASMIDEGAQRYNEMCVACHSAPGVSPTDVARGLEPPAPKLYGKQTMSKTEAARAFWVVKNGIQMTGMPSFGKTHDDQKIWSIVAFLNRLSSMSSGQYQKLAGR